MPIDNWNDEPPEDPNCWLHHVLVGLHKLTQIPPFVFALVIGLTVLIGGWAWQWATTAWTLALIASIAHLIAVIGDWIWLTTLPKLNISYGPVEPSLTGLIGVRFLITLSTLLGLLVGLSPIVCLYIALGLHILAFAAIFYATRLEPFQLEITHLTLPTTKLPAGKRIRLVQVSDLHVERITQRERNMIEQVNALHADYLLLTGDYLNFSYIGEPKAVADCRQVLSELEAKHGTYAIRGTHQVDPNALLPVLFDGLPIHWLRSEHITVGQNETRITFAGASSTREAEIDIPAVQKALDDIPPDVYSVLLFHVPERVQEAQAAGVDLYLAGHTHGGQIRLPFFGAMVTGTKTGKQYEMGRYDLNDLTLYVCRGIGMEGMAAPRARFLSPPELVCVDIVGE